MIEGSKLISFARINGNLTQREKKEAKLRRNGEIRMKTEEYNSKSMAVILLYQCNREEEKKRRNRFNDKLMLRFPPLVVLLMKQQININSMRKITKNNSNERETYDE